MSRYDPETKKWTSLPNMIEPREDFQLILAKDLMYAIGGKSKSGAISSVEYYEKSVDRWKKTTPMPTARSAAGAALLGNHIYVLGGISTEGHPLTVVERFDLDKKQWTKVFNYFL